ncbi:hypothetical protein ECDEC10F_6098 [Escherichia coli DEC10F]|nr:hypothetical protein ECDEC10F_6098 [Escherichia coli DEC10F]
MNLVSESGQSRSFFSRQGRTTGRWIATKNVSEIGRAETAEFILNRQSVLHQCRERFPSPPDPELIITEKLPVMNDG